MRYIFIFSFALLLFLAGCSSIPQDKQIAKIGDTYLFVSDAEFLSAIRHADHREKQVIVQELQQVAETRRIAEVSRRLFVGEQTALMQNLAETENSRLAQVYTYFYLQANMGHTNKALMDYYKKNKPRYTDSIDFLPFFRFREKIAEDLFLEENPALAAQVNDSNRAAILDSCRRAIAGAEIEKLKSRYKVELVKIEPPNMEEYYKSNPDKFQTKAGYKLLSLSDADSATLARKTRGITTRDEFAKIAKEMPLAKAGHAIMGIGMLPALDAEISNLGAQKFTKILRAPDTQAYYVFYIDSIIAPQLKSWERSKSLAKSMLANQGDIPLDSSTVLVTMEGKPLITEKEVLALKAKMPPFRAMSFRRDDAVKSLMEESLYARAAKEKAIDRSSEYVAWGRQLADRAYVQMLMDSLVTKTLGISEDSLKAAYEAEKDSLFAPKSYEDSKLDVAVWLRIPDIAYKREFALNGNHYGGATSWESIKRTAYKNIRYREFRSVQEKVMAELQKNIPVLIIDPSWGMEFAANDFATLAEQAKSHYEKRNLQEAKKYWEIAKMLFPENDSIQRAIAYELANVYQELGSYAAAVTEYKAIAGIWPQDSSAYKAYFMQGFVLSEFEKKDSLALLVFEEMLSKFPNSELSEDAKILAENIKSGGKVLEDLIKKIEAQSEGRQ